MTRRTRLQQIRHVAYEVAYFLVSIISRMINATLYGGSMHQTLSARAHIEGVINEEWGRRADRIDRLFFWEEDHCAQAWAGEVERAWKTIQRNGGLPESRDLT